ncbi:unnamed protein product, partial [Symbiodinium sp. CCMP2456]
YFVDYIIPPMTRTRNRFYRFQAGGFVWFAAFVLPLPRCGNCPVRSAAATLAPARVLSPDSRPLRGRSRSPLSLLSGPASSSDAGLDPELLALSSVPRPPRLPPPFDSPDRSSDSSWAKVSLDPLVLGALSGWPCESLVGSRPSALVSPTCASLRRALRLPPCACTFYSFPVG